MKSDMAIVLIGFFWVVLSVYAISELADAGNHKECPFPDDEIVESLRMKVEEYRSR